MICLHSCHIIIYLLPICNHFFLKLDADFLLHTCSHQTSPRDEANAWDCYATDRSVQKLPFYNFAPMYPADTGHIVVLHHSSAVIPSFLRAASRQYSHCLPVLILPLYQNPAGMDTVPFKTRTVLMLISPYKDSSCFFEKTFLLLSSSRFHRSRRTMFQTAAAVETVLLLYLEWLSR